MTQNTKIAKIHCYNNRLPLNVLYGVSQKIAGNDNKWLGSQNNVVFETKSMELFTELDLSAHAKCGTVNTVFAVKKGTANAVKGTDYNETGGKITFLKAGSYTVEMTNTAVASHSDYPAKSVTGTITVTNQYLANPIMTMTTVTTGQAGFFLKASAAGPPVWVDWGNGEPVEYAVGTTPTSISNTPSGSKNIKIYGDNIIELVAISRRLTALDVSRNPKLTLLNCENNQLTALDVSKNTALVSLLCDNNQLTALDVSKNIALVSLICNNNQLGALDVSANTELKDLVCHYNQLISLDVRRNTKLVGLECYHNLITDLNMGYNTELVSLGCAGNRLDVLEVDKNTKLIHLYCSDNRLTALYVSKNTLLTDLRCETNQLTALDVSKNTRLTGLDCSDNRLTALEVDKNTELTELSCSGNQINTLDISKNTLLTKLACDGNRLTDLNINSNTALTYISCYNNRLPLGVLYTASQKIAKADDKRLGTQTNVGFETKTINAGGVLDLSVHAKYGATNTMFAVKKGTTNAVKGTDYNETGGKVSFLKTGSYTVEMTNTAIASHPDYAAKAVTGTIAVSDAVLVTGITLNKTTMEITVGTSETLIPTVEPANAADKTLTWTSSNTDVATVDVTGKVSAVATGTANIKAVANDGSGKEATCAVTVTSGTTGVEDMDAVQFKAYPNPTDGRFMISFDREDTYRIVITDVAGKTLLHEVYTGRLKELDISRYSDGVYFVAVDNGKRQTVVKVVKKK